MADITGNYEMYSSDNFDKYLEAIGVGFVLRKIANNTPNVRLEIRKNGDDYNMKSISTFKTVDASFKLGQEFKETTADGREVNTTFNLEGNTLKQVQRGIKDPGFLSTIDREFTGDNLIATIKYKDVTAVRKYKKV